MKKYCIICNSKIPPQRIKILPNTKVCVGCSTSKKKGTITITKGEGDHTWNETIHMESDDYESYMKLKNKHYKIPNQSSLDDIKSEEPEVK